MNRDFEEITNGIKKHATLVYDFLDCNEKLINYAKSVHQNAPNKTHQARQVEIKNLVKTKIKQLFPKNHFNLTTLESETWVANIVDHHATLNHPLLLATNIIGNLHRLTSDDAIVVLSASGVPFNDFFNKKGFKINGKKVNLFTAKDLQKVAYSFPLKKFEFMENLKKSEDFATFSKDEIEFLEKMENLMCNLDYSNCKNYADQITILDNTLWPLLFEEKIRKQIAPLIYIPQEEICAQLISKVYSKDEKSFIHQTLFSEDMRRAVVDAFDGITGCWTKQNNKGTHFFWAISDELKFYPLELQDTKLISTNKDFKYELVLTPEAVSKALDEKRIYPGLFLVFACLTFYGGIINLTGYGSMNYLYKMQQTWAKLLEKYNFKEDSKLVAQMSTKRFVGGPIVTYTRKNGKIVEQYAFDIIKAGGLTQNYIDHLGKMTFANVLKPALIDVYASYVPQNERKPLKITVDELAEESFKWIK